MSKVKVEIDVDLQDLIPNFIENRKKEIKVLFDLIETQDMLAIAQMSHKIKGAAAGYGFIDLSEMASRMEVAAKKNEPLILSEIWQQMNSHFQNIEIHYIQV